MLQCTGVAHCSLLETVFLLFTTVTTVSLLTTVTTAGPALQPDSPHCLAFGLAIIWWAWRIITIGSETGRTVGFPV